MEHLRALSQRSSFFLSQQSDGCWNEYTTPAYGGGSYGGVPMYSYDFFGVGENSNFASISHINEGCVNLNTAQERSVILRDLWQANVQMVDGSDGSVRLLFLHKLGCRRKL